MRAARPGGLNCGSHLCKSAACGGAASPPSEEGGGCLHKGFEQADGGRDTPSMCESSRYSRQKKQMTAFSLSARLPLGANSALALSLPQSFVAAKRQQNPAPSSEGAEAATAASHRFSFAVKVRRKRYPLSPIQPLSRLRRQLPFNKERSSVIYRGKGGNAACVWRKAPNTNVSAA